MTRSFGLDACLALEALKTSVEKFKDDDLNEDLARECACKAWHLCDHVSKALGPNSRFATLKELQEYARGVCPELAYLQNICIETKHGEITRGVAHIKIKEARHHRGAFSHAFDIHAFDISRLEIELLDGQTVFFIDVVDRAVGFWLDFFEDHVVT